MRIIDRIFYRRMVDLHTVWPETRKAAILSVTSNGLLSINGFIPPQKLTKDGWEITIYCHKFLIRYVDIRNRGFTHFRIYAGNPILSRNKP